jgi:hypothetical protein
MDLMMGFAELHKLRGKTRNFAMLVGKFLFL